MYFTNDPLRMSVCSARNVVASPRQALLVDAPGETSKLDKPPHRVKGGFHRGSGTCVLEQTCKTNAKTV